MPEESQHIQACFIRICPPPLLLMMPHHCTQLSIVHCPSYGEDPCCGSLRRAWLRRRRRTQAVEAYGERGYSDNLWGNCTLTNQTTMTRICKAIWRLPASKGPKLWKPTESVATATSPWTLRYYGNRNVATKTSGATVVVPSCCVVSRKSGIFLRCRCHILCTSDVVLLLRSSLVVVVLCVV